MTDFNSNGYQKEARERFGTTAAFKEYEQKTANYQNDDWQVLNEGLNDIFVKFARCKKVGYAPDSALSQELAKQLQDFITQNFYNCTNEILLGLSKMYVCDERFQKT